MTAAALYQPTPDNRHTVMVLVANGDDLEIIAQALNITVATLRRHFKNEIQTGRRQIVARVGYAMVKEALAGNVAAARYWLQSHGGPAWRIPKENAYQPDPDNSPEDDGVVHFYMPSNRRDLPELEDDTMTIDAVVEEPEPRTGTDDAA